MKNKRGFTLIELLIVIIILVSLLVLSIVKFNDVSKKNKSKAWDKVKKQIIVAAMDYYETNEYKLANVGDESVNAKVSIRTLVDYDYLNVITNPETEEKIDPCSYVEVTKKDNKFIYKYIETPDGLSCDKEEIIVVKDVGAPEISVEMGKSPDGENNFYKTEVDILTTVDTKENGQIKEVRYSYDGMDYYYFDVSNENIFTYELPAQDGKNIEVEFVATNLAGKSARATIKYSKDTTKPKLNVLAKVDTPEKIGSYSRILSSSELSSLNDYKSGNWTKNGIYFKMSSSDDISGINSSKTYCTDSRYDSEHEYYKFKTYRRTVKTSNFDIVCKAVDQAGNESDVITYNAKVDTTKPSCSVKYTGTKGWNNWFVTNDVNVNLVPSDKESGIKEYGLTTSNSTSYNNSKSNKQNKETKGTTWFGYVKDNVGNVNTCSSLVKLEKKVEITFDPTKTNKAVSAKHGSKIFNKNYTGVCGYGECSNIKCLGPDEKRVSKNYFARACTDVYTYSRYFYVNSVSTGTKKSVQVTDLVDDNYDDLSTSGMKRSKTLSRFDCKEDWGADYKYNSCGDKSGSKNDFSAHLYKYVSESGLQSNAIRLYTEYRYDCGY